MSNSEDLMMGYLEFSAQNQIEGNIEDTHSCHSSDTEAYEEIFKGKVCTENHPDKTQS